LEVVVATSTEEEEVAGWRMGRRETREAGESEVGRLPEAGRVRKEMCELMWGLTCWTQRHINEKLP
jgi:hypothetical protein